LKTNEKALPAQASFKKSVVSVYETPAFGSLLREVLHPGGLDLTERMARMAQAGPGTRVLDIACGKGIGSLLLAERYSCRVTGIELSKKKIFSARSSAKGLNARGRADFVLSDAENLPFSGARFDVVLSECSFSTFPDKQQAAQEICRVLKPKGRMVVADIFFKEKDAGHIREATTGQPAFPLLPCLSGAAGLQDYIQIFRRAGLEEVTIEDHSTALRNIGYRMALTFGDWENFLRQLSSEIPPVNQKDEGDAGDAVKWTRKALSKAKLGYALMLMQKVS
jgi:ubiquinone/menaquinone biosynthesis C-methylase UbiE